MPDLDSLSLDQRLALKTAARNLQDEFSGTFSVETIELFLQTSYDQFADRAKVTHFLPLMAERFARQRLTALARVEGKHDDGLPIVLFLCVHNAGRSQMALGWFKRLAGDRAVAWSGGSEPSSEINPAVVDAMAEVGIDIRSEFPKPWTDEILRAGGRRGDHGLRGRVPDLSWEALRGLGARRPRGDGRGRGAPGPGRDRRAGAGPAGEPGGTRRVTALVPATAMCVSLRRR